MQKYISLFEKSEGYLKLCCDISLGRISHAYILYGADAVSLDTVATMFAARLFCKAKNAPCYECSACRKVTENLTSDILYYPEGEKDKFLVADSYQLLDESFLLPQEFDYRILSVAHAQTMTTAAQNKLLKTIEEPSPNVIIILKAVTLATILPTVLSRSRVIKIDPIDPCALSKELQRLHPQEENELIEAASLIGNIELAEKILSDSRTAEILDFAATTLSQMQSSKDILAFSSKAARLKDFVLYLDYIQLLLRDINAYLLGKRELIAVKSKLPDIELAAESFTVQSAAICIDKISHAKTRLNFNCTLKSVADELLFSILEVKSKCRK